jgi:hypothetical protein
MSPRLTVETRTGGVYRFDHPSGVRRGPIPLDFGALGFGVWEPSAGRVDALGLVPSEAATSANADSGPTRRARAATEAWPADPAAR